MTYETTFTFVEDDIPTLQIELRLAVGERTDDTLG